MIIRVSDCVITVVSHFGFDFSWYVCTHVRYYKKSIPHDGGKPNHIKDARIWHGDPGHVPHRGDPC